MNDWFIYGLFALFLWGIWAFLPKLATKYLDPKSLVIFQAVGGTIVVLGVLCWVKFSPVIHTKGIIIAILAGLAGGLGGIFFFYALAKGKASVVVTMTALYPLIAIILSFIILKEPVTLKQGIGIILALAAMVLLAS